MKRIISLSLIAGTALTFASSLSVYQDKTFYRYTPESTFIGLTKNINAKCEGESVSLSHTLRCPDNGHLCKLYAKADALDANLLANTNNTKLLQTLVKLPQPNKIDAVSWVDAAKVLAKEQTKLALEKRQLDHEKRKIKQRFSRETQATMPLALEKACQGELELTLPYGFVTFTTEYAAELTGDQVKVTQQLSIRNRSGIDMKADEAHFYYRPAQQYVRPIHFSPWIVGEQKASLPKKSKYPMSKMRAEESVMQLNAMVSDAPAPVRATYEDAREYAIKGLVLPSTGEPKTVPVMEWKVPVRCKTELFAYRNPNAFEVCSFKPKFQIEQNRWKITEEGKIVNERAVGEYEKDTYHLYTQIDQDIKVVRRKIVQKERETGIFGGTARKKDGFTLTITNKSDKEKKVSVTERIPTSTTEKIKVKLLSVKGSSPVKYQLLKDGKLTMNVTLAAHETKKIEVLFEISYDKDVKIDY